MSICRGNISTLLEVQELSLFDVKNTVFFSITAFEITQKNIWGFF